jgi:hypothetical protein
MLPSNARFAADLLPLASEASFVLLQKKQVFLLSSFILKIPAETNI